MKLELAVEEFRAGKRNYSPKQITEIRRALWYLKKMQILKVFGYNSSGFDIPVLFQGKMILLYISYFSKFGSS